MEELDRNNPDLWKWGFLYYNPKDPNILPYDPLSRGVSGITFNFGHKKAPLVIVFLSIIILAFAGYIVFYM
jgi:uncharacterized membrane protein